MNKKVLIYGIMKDKEKGLTLSKYQRERLGYLML